MFLRSIEHYDPVEEILNSVVNSSMNEISMSHVHEAKEEKRETRTLVEISHHTNSTNHRSIGKNLQQCDQTMSITKIFVQIFDEHIATFGQMKIHPFRKCSLLNCVTFIRHFQNSSISGIQREDRNWFLKNPIGMVDDHRDIVRLSNALEIERRRE